MLVLSELVVIRQEGSHWKGLLLLPLLQQAVMQMIITQMPICQFLLGLGRNFLILFQLEGREGLVVFLLPILACPWSGGLVRLAMTSRIA